MQRLPYFLALLLPLSWPTPAQAQWWDAQQPQRGELQIGLSGRNVTVDHRFRPDGTIQPLADVFHAELDARLVPQLDSLDAVLARFFPSLGLSLPQPSTLGDARYDVVLERTKAPISLSFGATDWLAVFVVVPVVEGKSFVAAQLDSMTASAGNGATAFGEDPDQLFQDLNNGIAQLEAIVAADTLSAASQVQAEQLLADARAYEAGMTDLRALEYVPTDSGAAGRELTVFYEGLQNGFLDFQIELPAFPLAGPLTTEQAVAFSSGPGFGIQPPQNRSTGIKFGDIEVGLSIQPLNTFRRGPDGSRPALPLRARLDALYRFATGSAPKPELITDVGAGAGQPDLEFRGTLDVGFGSRLWLSLFAGYNIQLEAEIDRLITLPVAPIQLGAYAAAVAWDPGDVLRLVAAPRFNLTPTITFSGLFVYTSHARDRVRPREPIDPAAPFQPSDLEVGTRYKTSSIGFAARYSATDWTGDRRAGIPADVELSYLHTASGRNGFAPQQNVWQVGLRYYLTVFP